MAKKVKRANALFIPTDLNIPISPISVEPLDQIPPNGWVRGPSTATFGTYSFPGERNPNPRFQKVWHSLVPDQKLTDVNGPKIVFRVGTQSEVELEQFAKHLRECIVKASAQSVVADSEAASALLMLYSSKKEEKR